METPFALAAGRALLIGCGPGLQAGGLFKVRLKEPVSKARTGPDDMQEALALGSS